MIKKSCRGLLKIKKNQLLHCFCKGSMIIYKETLHFKFGHADCENI